MEDREEKFTDTFEGRALLNRYQSAVMRLSKKGLPSLVVEHSALARLLVRKGVVTEREYLTAVVDEIEEELSR